MCGIVGGVSGRNLKNFCIQGLEKLEYRGYDSAGISLIDEGGLHTIKSVGKIKSLIKEIDKDSSFKGNTAIGHTRWATHGKVSKENSHPHEIDGRLSIVHNGIIENYQEIKAELEKAGYEFISQTDTEVGLKLIDSHLKKTKNLPKALRLASKQMKGSYAIAVISYLYPDKLIAIKQGAPLIIGIGIDENFVSSDIKALVAVTNQFISLEDGDLVELTSENITIFDKNQNKITREIEESKILLEDIELGDVHKHFMHKEVYQQPAIVKKLIERYTEDGALKPLMFGDRTQEIFQSIHRVHILACGTSFNAGLVAKYWIESIVKIPCKIDIASEYKYANPVIEDKTLFIAVSQSGETADTLAAIDLVLDYRAAIKDREPEIYVLAVCNALESALFRKSDLHFFNNAGQEIGVASTKAFTSQLIAFIFLTLKLSVIKGEIDKPTLKTIIKNLKKLPTLIESILALEPEIQTLAKNFVNSSSVLYLGRYTMLPIAMEGALKLKEISYIHAESYAAGELKHGPIALIDEKMPIIVLVHNDELIDKMKSNIEEVSSRGGKLYIITDTSTKIKESDNTQVFHVPPSLGRFTAPIVYSIPLQLLAYHVALIKGTDIDHPRNLAKSVTVE